VGWQRFNRTTNVFEVSDDKGSTWQTLKIAQAGLNLGGNIAYTDQQNFFNKDQAIMKTAPFLSLRDTSQGADLKNWDVINTAQTLRFRAINDAYSAALKESMVIDRAGTVSSAGNIQAGINFHNMGGFMYPGNAASGGAYQGTWYLGSHSSYGLYCNTGFYSEGGVYPSLVESRAHIRAAGGLYDYGRAYPIGTPNPVNPDSYLSTPHLVKSGNMHYAVMGYMMFIHFYVSGTVNVGAPNVGSYVLILPEGKTAYNFGHLPIAVYDGGGWGTGMLGTAAGSGNVQIYASALRPFQSGQLLYLTADVWIPIN
jgi:hypothetical protein